MRRRPDLDLATLIWALLTGVLLLAPVSDRAPRFTWDLPGLDKLVHFTLFFLLAGLAARSLAAAGRARPRLTAAAGAMTYSLLLELAQRVIPGRESTASDAVANLLGAASVVVLLGLRDRRR